MDRGGRILCNPATAGVSAVSCVGQVVGQRVGRLDRVGRLSEI